MRLKKSTLTIISMIAISANCGILNPDCDGSDKFPYELANHRVGCPLQEEDQDETDKFLVSLSQYQTELGIIREAAKSWELSIDIKPIAIPKAHHFPRIYISENGCKTNAWIGIIPEMNCLLLIDSPSVLGVTNRGKGNIILNIFAIDNLSGNPLEKHSLIRAAAAHEIGHLLDLKHSSDIEDVMYYVPARAGPSRSEINKVKLELIYRSIPNVIYVMM